ncbi:MAG: glycoside hydrolase family 2 [Bacteroidales bacterium]|nr:glycoside hydrolase family 2 [Bacteroidales bacterium]
MSENSSLSRRTFLKSGVILTAGAQVAGMYPFSIPAVGATDDAADRLYELFKNPPTTAKPFVRWWWNGDRLSADEILRELDLMRDAGIGGVEINPILFPGGPDLGIPSLPWLSQEWIDMVKVALKGAAERGIICDIIVGSGWPFGAEILEGDDRSQLMTLTSRKISGPEKVSIKTEELVNDAKPRVHAYKGATNELYAIALAPVSMEKFVAPTWVPFDGNSPSIEVDVPAGEHILYALVKCTGFQAVINGAPGAAGPVLNHYSKEATEKFLNRMSDALFPQIKDLKGFRALFCDSMELEGANWCPDFLEEFKRRRGYDIKPYLPFILFKVGSMGSKVAGGEITKLTGEAQDAVSRARYDFYTTCMAIITDRFLITYTKWCNEHGFKSRMQPYGNEFHPLEASLPIDIPECETWIWGRSNNQDNSTYIDFVNNNSATNVNKYVASAVHLSGKKICSCEEITNTTYVFRTTLEQVKICGDQSNLSGVNHSILHGFNYSPLEVPFPGWIRYGTFFNERNTWWPYFKQWSAYKARLSALLQETEAFADIAVLHPLADMWTLHGPQRDPFPGLQYPPYQYKVWEAIHKNGNACDYTCESIIQKSKAENGALKYGTRSYNTLLLLEVETIQPATAKALAKFVAKGGKLVFVAKEPYKSPGLVNHVKNDKAVAKTIAAMKKAHPQRIFTVAAPQDDIVAWWGALQKQCDIKPYMNIDRPNKCVSQIRHRAPGKDIFFLSNASQNERFQLKISFPDTKGVPQLWDAETGERRPLPADKVMSIDLPPATSQLIVFEESDIRPLIGVAPVPTSEDLLKLSGWTMRLEHIDGDVQTRDIDEPFDLSRNAATRSFAGTVYYEKKLDNVRGYSMVDLGKVEGVSEAWLDDVPLGVHWYGRHLYALHGDASGKTLKIKVITVVGNYIKALPQNHAHGWVRSGGWAPMGLIGPVQLIGHGPLIAY